MGTTVLLNLVGGIAPLLWRLHMVQSANCTKLISRPISGVFHIGSAKVAVQVG
jgi:hypothetical protein